MRVTFGDPGSRSGAAGSDFVAVDRGEHLLWTITTTGVFYRRLPPA